MKVCITAANPAAANQVVGLLLALLPFRKRLEVVLLAQEPALSILATHSVSWGLAVHRINASRHPRDLVGTECAREVAGWLQQLQPDLLITGLSGPDLGVDEWAVHYARLNGIRSVALQDFPGWVVSGPSGPADVYWVESEFAAMQTATQLPSKSVRVVGSLRQVQIANVLESKSADVAPVRKGTIFFGQPLWHLPGYRDTLVCVGDYLASAGCTERFYRPHPLESDSCLDALPVLWQCLSGDESYWHSITACRSAYSCFSTALRDIALASEATGTHPEHLAYILLFADVRQALLDGGGSPELLFKSSPGCALIGDKDELSSIPSYMVSETHNTRTDAFGLWREIHLAWGGSY